MSKDKLLPVTALSSWIRCPRQFFMTYVIGQETELNPAIVLGLIKHKLCETMSKNEQQIIEEIKPSTNLEQHFKNKYSQILVETLKIYKGMLKKVQLPIMAAYQKSIPITLFETQTQIERIKPFLEKGITGTEIWN